MQFFWERKKRSHYHMIRELVSLYNKEQINLSTSMIYPICVFLDMQDL